MAELVAQDSCDAMQVAADDELRRDHHDHVPAPVAGGKGHAPLCREVVVVPEGEVAVKVVAQPCAGDGVEGGKGVFEVEHGDGHLVGAYRDGTREATRWSESECYTRAWPARALLTSGAKTSSEFPTKTGYAQNTAAPPRVAPNVPASGNGSGVFGVA